MPESPHILLVVTGGIAAYKSCELLRELQKSGAEVRVVMTEAATQFVSPLTFEALSGYPVLCDLFDFEQDRIAHINLSAWADVIVVCPATANIMAKMVAGIADDAASSTLLAADGPVVVAPAMNERMWKHSATQENLLTLSDRGIAIISPETGRLACGDVGEGKLAAVEDVAVYTFETLEKSTRQADSASSTSADDPLNQNTSVPSAHREQILKGKRVLITAGPTHEAIDPVRFISNESSGKMGYALARAAQALGAETTLISGPVALEKPAGINCIDVVSAQDMYEACVETFKDTDIAILAAAVADYTPQTPADHKLKKSREVLSTLELKQTQDILAALSAAAKDSQLVVGFAAETDNLIEHAQEKLAKKGCHLIVANDVSQSDSGFGSDTNHVWLVTASSVKEIPVAPKEELAYLILEALPNLSRSHN